MHIEALLFLRYVRQGDIDCMRHAELHFAHVIESLLLHPCEGEEELDAEGEDGVVVAHVVVRRDHRRVPDA